MTSFPQEILNGLYLDRFIPKGADTRRSKCMLYVHGGPGANSVAAQKFIENSKVYNESDVSWLFLDQRSCGRSKQLVDLTQMNHESLMHDLMDVVAYIQSSLNIKIDGIYGHSYGSWLLYDAVRFCEDDTFKDVSIILGGRSFDRMLSRKQLLYMDLLTLRLCQPEDYKTACDLLDGLDEEERWQKRIQVRDLIKDKSVQQNFRWGNMNACKQYAEIQKASLYPDNDSVFQQLRKSLYSNPKFLEPVNPKILKQKCVVFLGYHDFLMGGNSVPDDMTDVAIRFWNSGHYPHIEEPEKFLKEVCAII